MARRFKLNTSTAANLHTKATNSEWSRSGANAIVTGVDADPNGSAFVKVRFADKNLSTFACDLRTRANSRGDTSA